MIAVVVPVMEDGKMGVLAIRRGWTGFGGGEIALPGGFIEFGESWQHAAVREVREETNVEITLSSLKIINAHSVQGGKRIIISCYCAPIHAPLAEFQPNEEILERLVLTEPRPLIFASHTEVLSQFFQNQFT